jgi:hypothetical protein
VPVEIGGKWPPFIPTEAKLTIPAQGRGEEARPHLQAARRGGLEIPPPLAAALDESASP